MAGPPNPMKNPWLKGLALAASLVLPGSAMADARLQAVVKKLDAGQPVTLAVIGGSITTGYAAQPPRERGWAALLARSLGPRVNLVNAGLSGTDSAAAVQRLQAQVLDAEPDLVVTEFGVNDEWLDPTVRASSFEGLLRRLLAAKKPPAVIVLALTQQGNQPRAAPDLQLRLAAHYGLTALDFGRWMQARVDAGEDRWAALYDEPVHPNETGHQRIALALAETLRGAAQLTAGTVATLPEPLHGRAHEFTRLTSGAALQPYRQHGFGRGGAVHPEWPGQQTGWTTTADDAEASFLAWGSEIAIFHAESDGYRNLEARVDDGPWVTLRGQVAERRGYLGWHYGLIGRDLEPGIHLLHVRMKRDEWAGSGRPASLLAVMQAGLYPANQRPSAFERQPLGAGPDGLVAVDDPRLRWVGRIGPAQNGERLLTWSGSELRARFTGRELALRFASRHWGTAHYAVEVDGQRQVLSVPGQSAGEWKLRTPLSDGEHELRLLKRTEAAMAESLFLGLRLAPGAQLLTPPPARALRLLFYGDSITAGACLGDPAEDQYEDLFFHDGTRAYGAQTAARLGADYLGIAVSGVGITATWGEQLMPQIWNRLAPRTDAPVADVEDREPDVVLVNLGQNDHGFPKSRGQRIAPDFGSRYLAFVRQLRARYPQARLVLLAGGMTAWRDEPAIPRALHEAVATLRAAGDERVWGYVFKAFALTHPRLDVHTAMADELTAFLQQEVLR